MMTKQDNPILFYGANWCGGCVRSKKVLDDLRIDYTYVDVDTDKQASEKVMEINGGNRSIPTIIFPDGSTLAEPNDEELKEKLGSYHNVIAN